MSKMERDDELESGADYFDSDEEDDVEDPAGTASGQPSPPVTTPNAAASSGLPIDNLDEMQRPNHVVEPIWALLIQLATSYIQGQAAPGQVSGTVPAAATSASHLVSELLTRYGHDPGTAAMIAVSNEGAQLWSQLGRSASIQRPTTTSCITNS